MLKKKTNNLLQTEQLKNNPKHEDKYIEKEVKSVFGPTKPVKFAFDVYASHSQIYNKEIEYRHCTA